VEAEAELSTFSSQILRVSHDLGTVRLGHELHVQEAQLFRALDRYLAGTDPTFDAAPPIKDAFRSDPNGWSPSLRIRANLPIDPDRVASRRGSKQTVRSSVERVYKTYAQSRENFDIIRNKEARGYGEGLIAVQRRVWAQRSGTESTKDPTEEAALWIPTTADKLTHVISERLQVDVGEAVRKTQAFLHSDHPAMTPYSDINSRLHAGMAMLCRGRAARRPQASDSQDITHVATFLPYVDVLITDRFLADLCNQSHMRIGERYGTRVRSLRPREIPGFIDWLDSQVRDSPTAALAERLQAAIRAGWS
jgi:hypothetical protein